MARGGKARLHGLGMFTEVALHASALRGGQ